MYPSSSTKSANSVQKRRHASSLLSLPSVNRFFSVTPMPPCLVKVHSAAVLYRRLRFSGDIASLARHFLARIGDEPGLRHLSLADSALNLLCAYDWPGNVRQLQAVLFRAAVFCDAEMLTSSDFPQLSELIGEQAGSGHHVQEAVGVMLYTDDGNLRPLEEIEADVIRLAIGHYRGRMTEVARRLGIGRSTLYRKLSDLGIDNAA